MLPGGSRLRAACVAAMIAAFGLSASGEAWGQNRNQQPKPPKVLTLEEFLKIKDTPLESLKVKEVGPNGIVALNFKEEPIYIFMHPDPSFSRVTVTGTADVTALKPGMHVRFMGTVDEKGVGSGEVAAMEIFTPAPMPMGVPGAGGEDITPGSETSIAGRILKVKDGKIDLQTNAKKIRKVSFPLAASPTITVAASDLSFIRPGDALGGTAKEYEKQLVGANVQVTMANPLTGIKKKATREEKGPSRREEKGDGDKPAEGAKPEGDKNEAKAE